MPPAGASVVVDLRGLLAGVTHADRRPELAPGILSLPRIYPDEDLGGLGAAPLRYIALCLLLEESDLAGLLTECLPGVMHGEAGADKQPGRCEGAIQVATRSDMGKA